MLVYFKRYSVDLFAPGVLDLNSAPYEGRCAAEFPILYWALGLLGRVFGTTEIPLRILNISTIFLASLMLMTRLTRVFEDGWIAYALVLMLFSSIVCVYYVAMPMPDGIALGLVLWGWAYILPCLLRGTVCIDRRTVMLWCMAMLLKVTMGISLVLLFVLSVLAYKNDGPKAKRDLIIISISLIIGSSWHAYAIFYNKLYSTQLFMTSIAPIWSIDEIERYRVMDLVLRYWWTKYFHPSIWHVTYVFVVYIIYTAIVSFRRYHTVLLLFLMGSSIFVILFYKKLGDHDYYFLVVQPLFLLLWAGGLYMLNQRFNKLWVQWTLRIGLTGLTIAGLLLARTDLVRRWNAPVDRYGRTSEQAEELRGAMAFVDPYAEARVVVIGDSSTQGALVALERQGWTFPGYPELKPPPVDPASIPQATHVLILGNVPALTSTSTPVASGVDWQLRAILRSAPVFDD